MEDAEHRLAQVPSLVPRSDADVAGVEPAGERVRADIEPAPVEIVAKRLRDRKAEGFLLRLGIVLVENGVVDGPPAGHDRLHERYRDLTQAGEDGIDLPRPP